jgi:hypothetical protein
MRAGVAVPRSRRAATFIPWLMPKEGHALSSRLRAAAWSLQKTGRPAAGCSRPCERCSTTPNRPSSLSGHHVGTSGSRRPSWGPYPFSTPVGIADYIENFSNVARRHSALNYLTPIEKRGSTLNPHPAGRVVIRPVHRMGERPSRTAPTAVTRAYGSCSSRADAAPATRQDVISYRVRYFIQSAL